MTEQMPKEQYEYIKRIQDDMLECTNMTENEAWDFAFRCWQCGYDKVSKEPEQYKALGTVEEICEWEYDELEEKWQTDCDVLFAIHDSDREITNYCPCCGKKIKVRCEDDI